MSTLAAPKDSHRLQFDEIRDDVASIISDSRYTTMTTVDRHGRPRSRVLIAVWELEGPSPVGWLGTYKSPIKSAHLEHNPHVGMTYWSPREDAAYLDSVARWVEDPDVASGVWDMYRRGSPRRVGYDPRQFWKGPHDPEFAVLRLDPWRVQVLRARDLASGRPSRIWRSGA